MSKMGIAESLRYLFQNNSFDDCGTFLWVTAIFRIVPSILFLNFLCCIMGAISALMMFNIGRSLMPKRYAYMAALTFSIASFTARHCVGVNKENVTSFLILAAFYFFFISIYGGKTGYILSFHCYSHCPCFFSGSLYPCSYYSLWD